MDIRLVVILYSGAEFTGKRRLFIEDNTPTSQLQQTARDLRLTSFDKKTLAIGIHPGPDFLPGDQETVTFSEHVDPIINPDTGLPPGKALVLRVGPYPDLRDFNFEGLISSVIFNGNTPFTPGIYVDGRRREEIHPVGDTAQFTSIPLVVELYNDTLGVNPLTGLPAPFQESQRIILVESSKNLEKEFGSGFNDVATGLVIREGSRYKGEITRFYEDPQPLGFDPKDQLGGSLDIAPGIHDLRTHRFNDRVSAVFFGIPAFHSIKRMSIAAKDIFVGTGIALEKGTKFTVKASGNWSNGGDSPAFVGPDGFDSFSLPGTILESANLASLIGKIGDVIFPVGADFSGESPAVGELLLGMNDVPGTFEDNDGGLNIEIAH